MLQGLQACVHLLHPQDDGGQNLGQSILVVLYEHRVKPATGGIEQVVHLLVRDARQRVLQHPGGDVLALHAADRGEHLLVGHPAGLVPVHVHELLPQLLRRHPDRRLVPHRGADLPIRVEDHRQEDVDQDEHEDQHEGPDPEHGGPHVLLRELVPVVLALHYNLEALRERAVDGGEGLHAPAEEDVTAQHVGREHNQEHDPEVDEVDGRLPDGVQHDGEARLAAHGEEEAEDEEDVVVRHVGLKPHRRGARHGRRLGEVVNDPPVEKLQVIGGAEGSALGLVGLHNVLHLPDLAALREEHGAEKPTYHSDRPFEERPEAGEVRAEPALPPPVEGAGQEHDGEGDHADEPGDAEEAGGQVLADVVQDDCEDVHLAEDHAAPIQAENDLHLGEQVAAHARAQEPGLRREGEGLVPNHPGCDGVGEDVGHVRVVSGHGNHEL
mmetsp:Transcript_135436/g.337907  ORF Transcript_135436/g.337907 Transcript_135436/m.337907 type:complete len:439 (+) Transcript_135436:727-2043(+)